MKSLSSKDEIYSNTAKDLSINPYERSLPVGINQLDPNNPEDNELLKTMVVYVNSDLAKFLNPEQMWLIDPKYLLSLVSFSVPIKDSQIRRLQLAEAGRDINILNGRVNIGPFLYEGLNEKGGFISGVAYHAQNLAVTSYS